MIVWHKHHCLISKKSDSSSDWVKVCLKVNLGWSRMIQLVNWWNSQAWLDGRWRVAFCSLWHLGSIWTLWLRCLLMTPRLLFLRGFCRPFVLSTFLVTFCLAPWAMVKNALCGHVGKCPAYVMHDCYPIVHLPEEDDNHFGDSTQLWSPRAKWL